MFDLIGDVKYHRIHFKNNTVHYIGLERKVKDGKPTHYVQVFYTSQSRTLQAQETTRKEEQIARGAQEG